MRWRGLALALILVSTISLLAGAAAGAHESFDSRVGRLVEALSLARSRGMNVSAYVAELDRAVRLYDNSNTSGALRIVGEVEASIPDLLSESESIHTRLLVKRYTEIGLLLSMPLLVYLLLPRAYLYLWYVSRRDWVVEGAEDDHG